MNKNSFSPSPYYKTPETFSGVTSDLEKMLRDEIAPKLSAEEYQVFYQKAREYITGRTSAKLDVFNDMKSLYAELPKVLNGVDSNVQTSILGKLKSSDLPAQVEKALDAVKTNIPGGKEILQAGEQITEKLGIPAGTVDAGKLAKKAGTVVQEVASDVQEQAGKMGEKLDEWGLGKFWKGFLEMIGALFAALGLDKFFDLSKFIKKDGKKGEGEGSSPAGTVAQKAEKLKEDVEKQALELKERTWNDLVKSGFIKDPKTQLENFNKVWGKYNERIKEGMQKMQSNVLDKKDWNLMDVLTSTGVNSGSFLMDLVKFEVIPTEAITAKIKEGSKLMIEFGLRSALTLVTKGPKEAMNLIGEYGFEELMQDKEKKALLLPIVYHHMSIPLFLAGKAANLMSSMALMPLYWETGTTVPRIQSQIAGAVGDFDKSAKVLTEYGDTLASGNAETKVMADKLRAMIGEMEVKTRIMNAVTNSPDASFASVEQRMLALQGQYKAGSLESKIITETLTGMKSAGANEWKNAVVKLIKSPHSESFEGMGWGKRITSTVQGAFKGVDDIDLMVNKTAREAEIMRSSLASMVKENWTLAKWFKQIGIGRNQSELIAAAERGNFPIYVKNADEAKEIAQRMARETPKGLEGFFRNLSFTIVIADVASTDDNKLATLAQDIAYMNPFYGAFLLVREGFDFTNGVVPKHPGYIAAGGAVAAIGAMDLLAIQRKNGNVFRSLAEWMVKPVVDAGKFGLDTIRFARHAYIGARNIGGMTEIGALNVGRATLSQNVRFGASFATALAIGFGVYKLQEDEKIFNELKGEGIVQADGGINTAKAKEKIASLPSESKEKVIKMLSEMLLGPGRTSGSYAGDISFDGSKVTALVDVTRDDTGKESLLDIRGIEEWKTALKDLGFDGTINYTGKAESYMQKYLAQYEKLVSPEMRKELYSKVGLSHMA